MIFPLMFPALPNDIPEPPTLYSLLESIVNFDSENPTKIKNLASAGRSAIFDFDYPLTTHITKEKFECMILNKFLMRRINFDTLTAFKIQLNVKLNEIMPSYNILFNALEGWNLFQDGEVETRVNEETSSSSTSTTSSNSGTEDLRYSNTPQNRITDVQNGNYVTDYNYNTTSTSGSVDGEIEGSNNLEETITRTPSNKVDTYIKFMDSKENIFSMIFEDLECLFYSLL